MSVVGSTSEYVANGGDRAFDGVSQSASDHSRAERAGAHSLTEPILGKWQRIQLSLLAFAWITGLASFFLWWFQEGHIAGPIRFIVSTLLIVWTLIVPGYFLFFVARMRRTSPTVMIPSHWRVAMVTTRAPSEPFDVVMRTLEAMLEQRYPHETWLADEQPTPEILEWCRAKGVHVVSRHGVAEYHRNEWPRRTKCKEGNLAYFYDRHGYDQFDFVVQLDSDHVPAAGYLEAMLRPFVDDGVGYVSAPSICDSNAATSWSARGRLFSESVMHGPLQAGYSNGFAPLCIGSHYAVRTRALREIGGLGPELAEDHSTTLMMNGNGWRGIHAIDAIAHGEGPPTLSACITQEFQWSRSLMVVFLTLLPKYWSRLPWRLRLQFLFCELWYPLFSCSMLAGLSIPVIAICSREPWVNVSYLDFVLHTLPLAILSLSIVACLKTRGLLRPCDSPLFSWEVGLFQIVRWPWVVYGTTMGVITTLTGKNVEFRVTPKGGENSMSLQWRLLLPYCAIVILTFLPTLFVQDAGMAQGYFFFNIIAQVMYVAALFGIVLVNRYENSRAV